MCELVDGFYFELNRNESPPIRVMREYKRNTLIQANLHLLSPFPFVAAKMILV